MCFCCLTHPTYGVGFRYIKKNSIVALVFSQHNSQVGKVHNVGQGSLLCVLMLKLECWASLLPSLKVTSLRITWSVEHFHVKEEED